MSNTIKFKTIVGALKNNVYYEHILVPAKIHDKLAKDGNRRVLCSVEGHEAFPAGLMPDGDGNYFIILNKARMKAFKLSMGQSISVTLEKDTSKYGMPMPEEFEEVLSTDLDGQKYFEQLTDGKKRNLIYMVAKVKNVDLKVTKSLIILDHLKANEGKLDFKLLNEAMKLKNRKY